MKTIKILFCAALLFSSCMPADHETRLTDVENYINFSSAFIIGGTIREFNSFYKDGHQDESYTFEQLSDTTWKYNYHFENTNLAGQIVKYKDNDTLALSLEGYDIAGDNSVHIYTTEDIVWQSYYYYYLAGVLRYDFSHNGQQFSWDLIYADEKSIISKR